ncbi:hypothetical protein [Kitasatospora azatica]|uniref:hypothetical protein n=1 Tax=Kitasatospora azatica TaxID=58347 RepID=UPI000565D5F7|nr:hypothetical protein [Kitasatospora azatica]
MPTDSSGIYADHGGLTAALTRLEAVSSHLKTTAENFRTALNVPGVPGDPYSDGLREWLEPSIRGAVTGVEGIGDTVLGTSDGIRVTRDAYHAANRAAGA